MMRGLVKCNRMMLKPLKRMRNLIISGFLFLFLSFHQSSINNATSRRTFLESALTPVKKQRTQFEDIKKTAVSMSESWTTDTMFQERRISRKNIFLMNYVKMKDQLILSCTLKLQFFFANLDIVITQLSARFEGLPNSDKTLSLHPPNCPHIRSGHRRTGQSC